MTARKIPKKAPPSAKQTTSTRPSLPGTGWKWHAAVVGLALLLTATAYANATQGGFVYDDELQIVKNPQIKPGGDIRQALTSDVWSFRVGRGESRSNYWRPLFIGWLAFNYRLFGMDSTGWHVMNILLHLIVTLLGYRVLLVLRLQPPVSAVATWVFAAHPAHIQSVTWISGSPDLLMSLFLMGTTIGYLAARERANWRYRAAAVLLFACALLSKEAALAFIAILFFSDIVLSSEKGTPIKPAAVAALKRCLPFLAAALIFVIVRYQILQVMRQFAPGAPGIGDVLLTVPSMLIFYVRQLLFPFEFGPIYSVRYVTATNIGLMNFLLPVILLATLAYAAHRLYKRNLVFRFGLIWLFLPLVLVLDPRIFVSEMLVQDRYLYLPVFGAAMLFGGGLVELAGRVIRGGARKRELAAVGAGLLIACALAVITLRFNPVWNNGVSLWEQGVRVDPSSALANAQLGNEYQRAGRLGEAKDAISRAIELGPDMTTAYLTRGIIAVRERRYEDAERDLKQVLNSFPDYDVPREQLAVAYQQQGRLDESIALFEEGRRLIPAKQPLYTINIAVLHKLTNRNAEALAELESLLPGLNSTGDPDVLIAWWYLGELYREQGRADHAVTSYERYLKATEGDGNPQVIRLRDLATQSLRQVKK
ncbi:MAG: tetratricopeptide repeat protein [Acidobacteriota bacterium]